MKEKSISFDRLLFGHEYWISGDAIDEIEIYCELLDHLQDKSDPWKYPVRVKRSR